MNIEYVGPLRSSAKRFYLSQVKTDDNLDSSGELLPYFLKDSNFKKVRFKKLSSNQTSESSLTDALNYWLYYLRTGKELSADEIGNEIEVESYKDILVELKIKSATDREYHSLADSGVGYSQVLPILVKGLVTNAVDTLIFEQPELHLHPALQIRLVDFFISLMQLASDTGLEGKILIETHSEHIVNALRVKVAEDETGILSKKSKIFFIDSAPEGVDITEISIRPDGMVPDWPPNFFGEALSLSSRLLKAQKRFRKNRENKE